MLKIKNLCKCYENDQGRQAVLNHISLKVEQGDFFVLLGKSGCGKTTFFRCAGGFLPADSGTIVLDGIPLTSASSERMMILQSFDQLFPWLTIKKNITYDMKKVFPASTRAERDAEALRVLAMTGLSPCAGPYPHVPARIPMPCPEV